jgi:hypothetical protein
LFLACIIADEMKVQFDKSEANAYTMKVCTACCPCTCFLWYYDVTLTVFEYSPYLNIYLLYVLSSSNLYGKRCVTVVSAFVCFIVVLQLDTIAQALPIASL